jgi:uncharacterized protein (DUF169 family)
MAKKGGIAFALLETECSMSTDSIGWSDTHGTTRPQVPSRVVAFHHDAFFHKKEKCQRTIKKVANSFLGMV